MHLNRVSTRLSMAKSGGLNMTHFNSKVLGAIAILVVFAHSSVPAQAQGV